MLILRQSTSTSVKIGPFVDDTDGKTPEVILTITQADVRLSKNGGDYSQKNDANACTHDELGEYDCPLNTTDTGTLGRIKLRVQETGALAVWHEYSVVTQQAWDSFFAADKLQVDFNQIFGTTLSEGTGGRLAAALVKLLDVAAPALTADEEMRGTDGANTVTPDAAGIAAGLHGVTNGKVDAIPTTAMRGTDNAALAATALSTVIWTAARAGVLSDWLEDGRLDALLDAIPTTAMRGTDGVDPAPMRGTDGANTVTPDAAGIAAGLHGVTNGKVDAIPVTPMRGTDGANTTTPPTVEQIDAELTTEHGVGTWTTGAGGEVRNVTINKRKITVNRLV